MNKLCLLVFVILCYFSTTSGALASSTGKVEIYWVLGGGPHFMFRLVNTDPNAPACATLDRYIVDLSLPQGPAVSAAVMSAYAQGKEIQAFGTGQCVLAPGSGAEDLNWIQTVN